MTNLYFVRHSKILYTHDDYSRQLSEEGKRFVPLVTKAFENIKVDAIVSSPYLRVLDTISGVSETKNLEIEMHDDLRERKVAETFIDDFQTFTFNQWRDFDYKLDGGESLNEVQKRGSAVLKDVITKYEGQNVVVGTHGTFMCVNLNYFNNSINFDFWRQVKMPDIYKASFEVTPNGIEMVALENIDL